MTVEGRLRVAVVGQKGFIGSALIKALTRNDHEVSAVPRLEPEVEVRADLFTDCHAVVNCAASNTETFSEEGWYANAVLPARLLSAAQNAGVGRFVHLSSIKSDDFLGLDAADQARNARGAFYPASKAAAENALAEQLAMRSDTKVLVLRPVPVFGPIERGRLGSFVRAARAGAPLPLADLRAQRSLISIYNVVAAIERTIQADGEGGTYTIADPHTYRLGEFYDALCTGFGQKPRSFPTMGIVAAIGRIVGGPLRNLIGEEIYDTSPFQSRFGALPVSLDEASRRIASEMAPRPD